MQELVADWEKKYPGCLRLTVTDQYLNMARFMPESADGIPSGCPGSRNSHEKTGTDTGQHTGTGGTDGAMLSARGLFTPNLGTGSWNHHGRYEFASVQKMETMKEIVKELMKGRDL